MKYNRRTFGAILLLMAAFGIQCSKSRFPSPFAITVQASSASVSSSQLISISSQCPRGTQLMGGGFAVTPPNASPSFLPIIENYPSSMDTWTVTADARQAAARGTVLLDVAYCLATPNYPLGMTMQSASTATTTSQSLGMAPVANASATATCPAGGIATGGGYRTQASAPQGVQAGTYNTGISAFTPVSIFGVQSGPTIGWRIQLSYPFPNQNVPTSTVYVLCSTAKGALSSGKIIKSSSGYPDPSKTDPPQTSCPSSSFTTGGGYELSLGYLLPSYVSSSLATGEFLNWQTGVFLPLGSITAEATCLPIPTIH